MDVLNLNRLNIITPYTIWKVTDGRYAFRTDYGVQFRIAFIRNCDIWQDVEAYEFGIFNENHATSPNDTKVRRTIECIIKEFFLNNSDDVLLYQCETGDNKQDARQRLFLKWFHEEINGDKYTLNTASIIAEGVINHIAVITLSTNPKLEIILQDFEDFVGFFSKKPE